MTDDPAAKRDRGGAAGTVAIVLAVGISVALNVITAALLYAAIQRLGIDPDSGISDNGVQILLAWGGAITSVLAGYIGFVIGKTTNGKPPIETKEP